jgi:dihydropteroate synthase
LIMGVLNVTPDSFSDGGQFTSPAQALAHARALAADGADIIDVGGESTRPGAAAVPLDVELGRVLPVVEGIAGLGPRVSIDTRKPEVAEAALRAGATIVNDVSGGADPRMAGVVKRHYATIILMHMRGTPETMQQSPEYPRGVVNEVRDFLAGRVRAFVEAGVPLEALWLDPGIGFGKTVEHNLELLHSLDALAGIAGPIVIGTSRKSFLGAGLPVAAREPGTIASSLYARAKGASVFRVHDVAAMKRALTVWEAIDAR